MSHHEDLATNEEHQSRGVFVPGFVLSLSPQATKSIPFHLPYYSHQPGGEPERPDANADEDAAAVCDGERVDHPNMGSRPSMENIRSAGEKIFNSNHCHYSISARVFYGLVAQHFNIENHFSDEEKEQIRGILVGLVIGKKRPAEARCGAARPSMENIQSAAEGILNSNCCDYSISPSIFYNLIAQHFNIENDFSDEE